MRSIGVLQQLAALVLLFVGLTLAAPPAAASVRPACHGFAQAGATPAEWTCGRTGWSPTAQVAWLRFDAASWRDAPPRRLVLTIGRLREVTVTARDATGVQWRRAYDFEDFAPLESGPRMAVAIPAVDAATLDLTVTIDRAWSVHTLTGTRLDTGARADGPWAYRTMVLLAMLAGLLCAPLIFDLAFFTALRERFLLWHALMAAGMLAQTVMATGLAVTLFGLTPASLAILSPLAFALAVAAAAFFSAEFLDPGALSPRMRRLLRGSGWWVIAVSCPLALQSPGLSEFGGQAYHMSFQPTVIVFALTMILAARRGSRAAKFQIAAWTPILLCGLDRLGRGIGLYALPAIADQAIYFAMAFEVVVTTLGVADRFMALRRERDRARLEAEVLASEAGSDVLTGLMNRRALEKRFSALRQDGFTSMAVLDLDHFKAVNDSQGHAVGDKVLRAVAQALDPDPDTIAVRLGGEEFVLLLRGDNPAARAERAREAIPLRIAGEVPGLAQVVTASMGLVEQAPYHDFALLYAHCDRLLYEAKRNGRNQTARERLQAFGERRRGERRGGTAVQAA